MTKSHKATQLWVGVCENHNTLLFSNILFFLTNNWCVLNLEDKFKKWCFENKKRFIAPIAVEILFFFRLPAFGRLEAEKKDCSVKRDNTSSRRENRIAPKKQ